MKLCGAYQGLTRVHRGVCPTTLRDFVPARWNTLATMVAFLSAFAFAPQNGTAAVGHHAPRSRGAVSLMFGQEMGNIVPFRVTIGIDGKIHTSGPVHANGTSTMVSKDALAAIALLARSAGFTSLPAFTGCAGTLPDIAARYIEVRTASWSHRASVRGGCVDALNQLFAVLMNLAHVSF